ncbi:hypothetical protein AQUCO_00300046v1 [Aquilegia coerulea]|uniref:E3 ubiquitin-protein ligase n=1 Tax=Aquilegia coerulea TaxID=218851 RepID=A0A2G5EWW9_AQUCA|nr:hypothetical protein AQUCO_00300046v1 [Aquilegia coerulea]PIA60263.1 hypothetical protein AQUCO_00300046v1 [Aquilegia coerulea]PIA60267.1 hypothetical protein AQUCO_00300046v1 [Aquilegia coerulea]
MEIDSPSPSQPNLLSSQDRILQRLYQCGVPEEKLAQLQPGIVDYVKENNNKLYEVVSAILPTHDNLVDAFKQAKGDNGGVVKVPSMKDQFRESMKWLQWLMFENEPKVTLKYLAKTNVNQRGLCGAVWGSDDIAYRCRTCENDSTCAICVPCFQNGNHKDHDYSLMYTGGGCCDCGDATAWKREGFCSKHKGAEQIKPLAEEIANSVGPVLDVILIYWKEKLLFAQTSINANPRRANRNDEGIKVSNELTATIVEMLLEFCKFSESLLSFISKRVLSSVGLLDILMRAERFVSKKITEKLHELLLKLLGEPTFKFEFAKIYIKYYPDIIKETIKESSDNILEKYPLLCTFSVQIFTVPTLTPRLVKEMNLLGILLRCLTDIFYYCLDHKEGHIQVGKWASLIYTTFRLVEDICYVMSHAEVPKYVINEQPDISRTWIHLLAYVQGMNPQKRVTGLLVDEENEHMSLPFRLGHCIAKIHSRMVSGAFSVGLEDNIEDNDGLCHAKVDWFSQESFVCSTIGRSNESDLELKAGVVDFKSGNHLPVPTSVMWLICECLRATENWLRFNCVTTDERNILSHDTCRNGSNFLGLKKTMSRISKGKSILNAYRAPLAKSRLHLSSELNGKFSDLSSMCIDLESEQSRSTNATGTTDMDVDYSNVSRTFDESILGIACGTESETFGLLNLSDWPDISYDVSSQDISAHIPLHRLLAMLLKNILSRIYSGSKEADPTNSVSNIPPPGCSVDFFGWILGGCHPLGFSAFLMEHPLRIRVFYAQVRAGMWRKNGEAVMLSCEYYRTVHWSEQCLELDLFLLQCCAALAPPDPFVERILDRFGLSNYLSLTLERPNEYEPILVQDMLSLIIKIVKDRRFCGNSTADNLRAELIYRLAMGDATHSELVKALPHGLSKSSHLQDILDTVAVYANPSEMKQGKYSLREACWEDLDLYHPRWNSRELQVAEERYLRFRKVSASTVQLPHWTNVFNPLYCISRIATCRTVLKIVRAVLYYAVASDKPSSSRAPDGVLITALHLLSLALDICYGQRNSHGSGSTSLSTEESFPVIDFAGEEVVIQAMSRSDGCKPQSLLSLLVSLAVRHRIDSVNNFSEASQSNLSSMIENLLKRFAELDVGCMTKLKTLAPEVVCQLLPPVTNNDIHMSGSSSNLQDHKAKGRERQAAILEKMRAAQSKFMESLKSTSNEEFDASTSGKEVYMSDEEPLSEEPLVCSLCRDPNSKNPVSFMVLLQKSRIASFAERSPPSWEQVYTIDKERKSMTKKESAVDSFTNDALPGEVDAFLDFIKAQLPSTSHIQRPSTSHDESILIPSIEMLEKNIYQSIQSDMQANQHSNSLKDDLTSPSDRDLNESQNVESILLGKYVASLSRDTSEQPSVSKIARDESTSSKTSVPFASFDGFGPANCDGIHISSCGHAVHQECRDRYITSLRERYNRRIGFEGGHVVDPDQEEFLCPVCRRLANSVLPTVPGYFSQVHKQMISSDVSSEATIDFAGAHVLRLAPALSLLGSAASMVGNGRVLQGFSLLRSQRMQPSLEPIFRKLCKMYFPDRCDKFSESGRVSHAMIFWDTLKYSLISTEIASRRGKHAEGSVSGIGNLYRELESSSGFVMSLLLQVVQSTRSESCLQVLLRFRAVQLFKESICSGVSIDQCTTDIGNQRGLISSLLKHADKEITYPDIQFWKRAADPVLAHDPFSSLMWILFSLPLPFLSSVESFLSVVHLLYVVCVIQALITCCGHNQINVTNLGFSDRLIVDICKIKGESVAAQQYFVSHLIDSSWHLKDVIRTLSHPYLRRCALLWRILKSSASAPFSDRPHQWDMSSFSMGGGTWECTTGPSVDLKEVQELENLFQIPDLDIVLRDKELHSLSLKWFQHFCKASVVRKYGSVLHVSPANPFRLMHLPQIYQDLLERYIKQQCSECQTVLTEPALCLLCGRLCSPSWKSCCRESGCHAHAISCGAGIGVFLLIRKTTILLQRSARQAPWPSPYLDAFGEEDNEMRRGKPLYLNEERYAALTHLVACHGLDQSSEVLRKTTIDSLFLI